MTSVCTICSGQGRCPEIFAFGQCFKHVCELWREGRCRTEGTCPACKGTGQAA